MIKSSSTLSTKNNNMPHDTLLHRDLQHVWHPCTQMKTFETHPPLIVHRAQGSYLYTDRGPIIDATSSWWCKSLGHGHPHILQAITQQMTHFEHVIGADTTYPLLVELSERLAKLSGLQHAFFASDGASAIEIAMKLALEATQKRGHPERNQFIALKNSYHGETLGALSVSDLDIYKKSYAGFGVTCHFLEAIPYVSNEHDPLWHDCSALWPSIEKTLDVMKPAICAIILEPIVQGAGGMRCYSADFLRRLAAWAAEHDRLVIADEIMTGLGRTGKWLACEHAGIRPQLLCLSKGLTGGTMPLSAVLVDHTLFDLFYDEGPGFIHSHTYSGHPLAVSAAVATLEIIESEAILQQSIELGTLLYGYFSDIAKETKRLTNVRNIGSIIAGDLVPHREISNIGAALHQEALQRGALLRPIGNTLYWLPPLNTAHHTIEALAEVTLHSMHAVYRSTTDRT